MPTGTVKWFNNAKGFGFILPDTGGEDIFAHYSSIQMDGYRTLKAGQPVVYEVAEGDKGLHATHIQITPAPKTTKPADSSPSDREEAPAGETSVKASATEAEETN